MHNLFEESAIKHSKLPIAWQDASVRAELEEFLQQNWNNRSVFYDDSEFYPSSRQQFLQFNSNSIEANNYIGTIIFRGQQLNIYPKIFKEGRGDYSTDNLTIEHLLHNIGVWISYCNKFAFPYLNTTSDFTESTDLLDLFISLYLRYVKKFIDRELFHRYEDITDDTAAVKGKINIADYITRKTPQGQLDKVQCTFSSFEFDNPLNRIIKHTCKYLLKLTEAAPTNQRLISQILFKLSEVSDVPCAPSDCDAIKLSKLHEYYRIILSMSKMFLLNKSVSYSKDDVDAFCFLFPTEVLYEGFLGGFMQETLSDKAKVRLQASDKYLIDDVTFDGKSLGKSFLMKNDYLVEMKDGRLFVLDAKYKELGSFTIGNIRNIVQQISSGDLYQVLAYAASRGLKECYLLYPMYRAETDEQKPIKLTQEKVVLNGIEHTVDIYVYRLPIVFEKGDDAVAKRLTRTIKSIFAEGTIQFITTLDD